MSETAISDLILRTEALETAVEVLEAKISALATPRNILRVPWQESNADTLREALRNLVAAADCSDFWIDSVDGERYRLAMENARKVLRDV